MPEFESIIAASYTQGEEDDATLGEFILVSAFQTAELLSELGQYTL